jgi:hypothetical protein
MKIKKILSLAIVISACCITPAKAQIPVTDGASIAQSIANCILEVTEASTTATNVINTFQQAKKIYDQGKEYYDKLKAVHNLVKDAKKVQQTILLVSEISDIYVDNFGKMLSDTHFRPEELNAISNGYAILLQESSDMLLELKDVVNVNGLSMTDSERMEIINYVHDRVRKHRDLVNYYTRKNISVSYLRAKKAGDSERVTALYGTNKEKYW